MLRLHVVHLLHERVAHLSRLQDGISEAWVSRVCNRLMINHVLNRQLLKEFTNTLVFRSRFKISLLKLLLLLHRKRLLFLLLVPYLCRTRSCRLHHLVLCLHRLLIVLRLLHHVWVNLHGLWNHAIRLLIVVYRLLHHWLLWCIHHLCWLLAIHGLHLSLWEWMHDTWLLPRHVHRLLRRKVVHVVDYLRLHFILPLTDKVC